MQKSNPCFPVQIHCFAVLEYSLPRSDKSGIMLKSIKMLEVYWYAGIANPQSRVPAFCERIHES